MNSGTEPARRGRKPQAGKPRLTTDAAAPSRSILSAPDSWLLHPVSLPVADAEAGLAEEEPATYLEAVMTAADVISQLQALPPSEVAKVRDWFAAYDEESPELLVAIDAGMRSLETNGARVTTRETLADKVRQWAGTSR